MSHQRQIRNILVFPRLYDLLQGLVGADRCRQKFLDEYARPQAGERVLDIGCGTARVLRFLPATVRYVGVDVNERYIAQARTEYGDRGEFLIGSSDLPDLRSRAPYDLVLAMFLMHHLSDGDLHALCRRVKELLKPDGRFVTIDPCRLPEASKIEQYLMHRDRGEYIRSESDYRQQVQKVFPVVQTTVRSDLLRIPYTHCIVRATP
jgi:SAM-dependent methyltransferase